MPDIKIRLLSDIKAPQINNNGDWVDLCAAEDITLAKGEFKLIPLGVAIQLPSGYEALLVPRSSTFKRYGILQTNSCGIIDESYCGNNDQWMMPVIAIRDTFIEKNSRICQFRIVKHQPPLTLCMVEELENENRGGFGSTGI